MHDGVISVSSVFGNGATFTLSLPTAKTVFSGVTADAQTGVISEKPLYRAAAYFMGLQECEAVKSLGYTDLDKYVAEYEAISETDVPARDKALTELLRAFGKERFASLEDELLSIDDFDDIDGPVTGLEAEDLVQTTPEAEVTAEAEEPQTVEAAPEVRTVPAETEEAADVVVSEAVKGTAETADPTADDEQLLKEQFERALAQRAAEKAEAERIEKEQQLQAKAEARKLLTQPVVQISADQKPAQQTKKDVIDRKTIHPITSGKRYNRGRATPEAEDASASRPEQTAEKPGSETKSSLKKLLDDSTPQHLK